MALSFILLIYSILSITDNFVSNRKWKVPLYVVAAIFSLYYVAIDIYLFIKNPYSMRSKLLDLFLRSILGEIYESNKVEWSLNGLNVFCNQFNPCETYRKDSFYFGISQVVRNSPVDLRNFGSEVVKMFNVIEDTDLNHKNRHFKYFISVRKTAEWLSEVDWVEIIDFEEFLKVKNENSVFDDLHFCKHCKIYDIEAVVLLSFKGSSISYSVTLKKGSKTINVFTGSCIDERSAFCLLCSFSVLEKYPDCGIIDMAVGGIRKGHKYLHCYKVKDFIDLICKEGFKLFLCIHERGGFVVAGDGKEESILSSDEIRSVKERLSKECERFFFESNYVSEKVKDYIYDRYSKRNPQAILNKFINTMPAV